MIGHPDWKFRWQTLRQYEDSLLGSLIGVDVSEVRTVSIIRVMPLSGNYMYHLLSQSVTLHSVSMFCMILTVNSDYFLKQH
jgi:hypothetical protein